MRAGNGTPAIVGLQTDEDYSPRATQPRTTQLNPGRIHGIAKLAFYGDLSLFVSMKRAGLSAAASMIAKVFFLM
jgi:hypothetical protein